MPLAHCLVLLAAACSPGSFLDGCEIVTERIVRLGGEGEEGSFQSFPSVSGVLGRGYLLAASVDGHASDLAMRFDTTGRFLGPLGQSGDGPGEFRAPELFLRYSGDSALVIDGGTRRATVLNDFGAPVREFPLPTMPGPQGGAVVLEDGTLVLSHNGFGHAEPLVTVAPDGRRLAQFGPPGAQPTRQTRTGHVVAGSGPDRFWSTAAHADYRFLEWSVGGELLREFTATRDWITPDVTQALATPTTPRTPFLTGAWQDEAGRLWIAGVVSDRNWARGLGPPVRMEGREAYPVTDWRLADDGILDVMDTATGVSIATRRFDEVILQAPAPGLIALAWETGDGWWRVELRRVALRGACAAN
ncbi:MAG TPA: hypothetical protein VMK53_02620 [Gemmatimonadales bacterium]|nr:hypothetical protein [Gemmatimonadales bacterium]